MTKTTTNAWYIYDILEPLVTRVVVADPAKAKAKMALPVKTDRRDTLGLAELLVTNSVPEVWVPPVPVREVRSLTAHRQRLVHQRTAAKNRLRARLQRHHILPPVGELFAAKQRTWWDSLEVSPIERLRSRHDLETIIQLEQLLKEVESELVRLSGQAPWNEVPWVLQLPGMGLITTMTILSAIGDISRFPNAKHLVGYSGLGARVYASGQTHHSGGITKQGRTELRAALVEAAWAAVRGSVATEWAVPEPHLRRPADAPSRPRLQVHSAGVPAPRLLISDGLSCPAHFIATIPLGSLCDHLSRPPRPCRLRQVVVNKRDLPL